MTRSRAPAEILRRRTTRFRQASRLHRLCMLKGKPPSSARNRQCQVLPSPLPWGAPQRCQDEAHAGSEHSVRQWSSPEPLRQRGPNLLFPLYPRSHPTEALMRVRRRPRCVTALADEMEEVSSGHLLSNAVSAPCALIPQLWERGNLKMWVIRQHCNLLATVGAL